MMGNPDDSEATIDPGIVMAWWDRLRDDKHGSRFVADPFRSSVDTTFLISLGPDGEPGMMAGIDPREQVNSELSGRNISVEKASISVGGKRQRVIQLICRELSLEAVFAKLVVDVIRRISAGHASHRAVEGALRDFRRLLERDLPARAGREEAIGLAGELLVLERMVNIWPDAWKTWNGPLGEIHDFHSAGQAIEVKASAHVGEARIDIHGINQLSAPINGLHLFQVVFIPDPRGSVSVPLLADEIRENTHDKRGFDERVATAGYHPSESARWEEHRFSLSHMACFEVRDGFPKLTEEEMIAGSLSTGIENVRYQVALDIIRQWQVPAGELDTMLMKFLDNEH